MNRYVRLADKWDNSQGVHMISEADRLGKRFYVCSGGILFCLFNERRVFYEEAVN
mgnify:CR=1 FL=1